MKTMKTLAVAMSVAGMMLGCGVESADGDAPEFDDDALEPTAIDAQFDLCAQAPPDPLPGTPSAPAYTWTSNAVTGEDTYFRAGKISANKPYQETWGLFTAGAGCSADPVGGSGSMISCGAVVVWTPTYNQTSCTSDSQCGDVGYGYCAAVTGTTAKKCHYRYFQAVRRVSPGAVGTTKTDAKYYMTVANRKYHTMAVLARRTIVENGVEKSACASTLYNQNPAYCIRVLGPGLQLQPWQ